MIGLWHCCKKRQSITWADSTMLTRFAEIFTSILFCLEQVVSEKRAVWRQYLCRIAMNTGFSSLSKFYSALFLVLEMGARRGKLWDRGQALHIQLYLSTGNSPDFGDFWLDHAYTVLWGLYCQSHSAFTLKGGRMLSYLREVTSKHPLELKQEQAISWL